MFTVFFADVIFYERWTGKKLSIMYFRVFGCRVYIYIFKEQRKKLDYKFRFMIFVGYIEGIKGYKVYDSGTGSVIYVRIGIFEERSVLVRICFREAATDSDKSGLSYSENDYEEYIFELSDVSGFLFYILLLSVIFVSVVLFVSIFDFSDISDEDTDNGVFTSV